MEQSLDITDDKQKVDLFDLLLLINLQIYNSTNGSSDLIFWACFGK